MLPAWASATKALSEVVSSHDPPSKIISQDPRYQGLLAICHLAMITESTQQKQTLAAPGEDLCSEWLVELRLKKGF